MCLEIQIFSNFRYTVFIEYYFKKPIGIEPWFRPGFANKWIQVSVGFGATDYFIFWIPWGVNILVVSSSSIQCGWWKFGYSFLKCSNNIISVGGFQWNVVTYGRFSFKNTSVFLGRRNNLKNLLYLIRPQRVCIHWVLGFSKQTREGCLWVVTTYRRSKTI